jgi:hypothetical protein
MNGPRNRAQFWCDLTGIKEHIVVVALALEHPKAGGLAEKFPAWVSIPIRRRPIRLWADEKVVACSNPGDPDSWMDLVDCSHDTPP